MKKNISFDPSEISFFFTRNKVYVLPVVVIIVCLVLLVAVIMPQAESWYASQQVIAENAKAIDALNKNIDVLAGFDDMSLTSNLTLATTALPGEKDLLGTLGAISRAAIASKVSLADYSFQSDTSTKVVSVVLVITGDLEGVKQFITGIKNELPLATVDDVEYQVSGGSTIHVSFYYQAYPHFSYTATTVLSSLTKKQSDVLSQLASFDSALAQPDVTIFPVSTPSAVEVSPTPTPKATSSASLKAVVSPSPVATGSASASTSAK